jgi:2-(1,2-epoxy-1,2-dihydrophenyl)acetyl-CoA isomerase
MTTTEQARVLETGTDHLVGEVHGPVAVLAFNRPDRRNALSDEMYDGFATALPAVAHDPEIRVLLVTGRGGAFCAGGDVKGFNERNAALAAGGARPSPEQGIAWLRDRQRLVSLALHQLPKPVVAALPGAAGGAGLSIALAADIRLAAERALLVTAFADIGASGDFGGSWFLTQLVGPATAKELYFTSPRLTAAEARQLGLVNRVLPDDGFEEAALAWCQDLASRAPIALRHIKENVNRALTCDLATALDAEAVAMNRTMSTADHREAAAAFVEKRRPHFTGS